MIDFIKSHDKWLEEYKKDKYKIWIKVCLSNDEELYLRDYSEWQDVKQFCINNKLNIQTIGLQYRSHSIEVDTKGSEGVYLVKSIMGSINQPTKHTYTIGKIIGDKVHKTIWITPELIQQFEDKDSLDSCFKEALIYNYDKESKT